jgi:hypothetical protein
MENFANFEQNAPVHFAMHGSIVLSIYLFFKMQGLNGAN